MEKFQNFQKFYFSSVEFCFIINRVNVHQIKKQIKISSKISNPKLHHRWYYKKCVREHGCCDHNNCHSVIGMIKTLSKVLQPKLIKTE